MLSTAQLDDLELLGFGVFGDVGYGPGPDELNLAVPAATAEAAVNAAALDLIDPEGAPLARVAVSGATPSEDDRVALTASLVSGVSRDFGHFRRFHLSPEELHEHSPPGGSTVVVEQALTSSDVGTLAGLAGPIKLLVRTGARADGGATPTGLMRMAIRLASRIPDVTVVAFPLAENGAGHSPALAARALAAYAPHGLVDLPHDGEPDSELAAIALADRPPLHDRGLVMLFTGLSGSGKSTIARGVHDIMLERSDRTVTSLDGDVVRRNLSAGLGFSTADRETNIRRIGWVAAEIGRHGGVAICSPIAPFASTRAEVRGMANEAGATFVLIHIATPVDECERRDRKGMYAKARRGEISEFTGISSPYEAPDDADLRIDTTGRDIDACVNEVIDLLVDRGLVRLAGQDV